MVDRRYLPRLLDPVLQQLLTQVPAVLITGPRATGKTTTAQSLARTVIRLDRPSEAAVARADPDVLLRGHSSPILIDEWQVVPAVLGAVKRAVDADPSPGRFLITGSARAQLGAEFWPGTGRMLRLPLHGLTTRERMGHSRSPAFFDRVVAGDLAAFVPSAEPPDLNDYIEELFVGGFPLPALTLNDSTRALWMASYLEQVVTRDVTQLAPSRNPDKLRRFVRTLAVHTATVVDDTTLYRAAGLNRRTGQSYESLLADLGLAQSLPAWWKNRIKRLVQRPKRLLNDAALAASGMGIDTAGLLRDGDMLGRLLETYVVAQLRAEAVVGKHRVELHHLRTERGRQEIDLIAELPDRRIIAIEVKATSSPSTDDARHLAWLRRTLPELFIAGIVLHTGNRVFSLGERLTALPIAALW